MTEQEALRLAINIAHDAMKDARQTIEELIAENKALKESLAQPEQEYFAVRYTATLGKGYRTESLRTWKIAPNEHGWWLFTEGTPKELWWHVYFDIGVGNAVFPTLDDVFAKIKEKNP